MEPNVITPAGDARPPLTPNQLAERVYEPIRRFVFRHAPPHLADDVAQDVVLIVLKKAGTLEQSTDRPPERWAFGVAKMLLLRLRRRGWRMMTFTDVVGPDDDAKAFDPAAAAPEAADDRTEAAVNRVRAALDELDAADRRLIAARYALGRTVVEQAAKMGRTARFVEERTKEALAKVKELLEVSP